MPTALGHRHIYVYMYIYIYVCICICIIYIYVKMRTNTEDPLRRQARISQGWNVCEDQDNQGPICSSKRTQQPAFNLLGSNGPFDPENRKHLNYVHQSAPQKRSLGKSSKYPQSRQQHPQRTSLQFSGVARSLKKAISPQRSLCTASA